MVFELAIAGLLLSGPLASEPAPARYGEHRPLARAATREVAGSSGVAPSHFDPTVFWTHNDHGKARLYAFRLNAEDRRQHVAADLGYLELRGFKPVDWEDLAPGPSETFYAFDGGNNPPCDRTDKRIVRFKEPRIDWNKGPRRASAPTEYVRFEYPAPDSQEKPAATSDQRYDAECLLVHPQTGDIYVVTKRDNRNQPVARVYGLPARAVRWNTQGVYILRLVADLSATLSGKTVASMITGGAVSADGQRILLRNYIEAYQFTLPAGRPFEDIFQQKPRAISLLVEPQGEGICYGPAGELLTTSEATARDPRFQIFAVPPATQPSSAPAQQP